MYNPIGPDAVAYAGCDHTGCVAYKVVVADKLGRLKKPGHGTKTMNQALETKD